MGEQGKVENMEGITKPQGILKSHMKIYYHKIFLKYIHI